MYFVACNQPTCGTGFFAPLANTCTGSETSDLTCQGEYSLALFLFDTNFNSTFQRLPIRLIKRLVIIHIFGAKIGLRRFESIERGGVPENHEK